MDRESKPAIVRQMERGFTEGKPVYLLPEGMEALEIMKPPSVIMFCVDECAAVSAYFAGSKHRVRATDEAADLGTPLVAAAAWLYLQASGSSRPLYGVNMSACLLACRSISTLLFEKTRHFAPWVFMSRRGHL